MSIICAKKQNCRTCSVKSCLSQILLSQRRVFMLLVSASCCNRLRQLGGDPIQCEKHSEDDFTHTTKGFTETFEGDRKRTVKLTDNFVRLIVPKSLVRFNHRAANRAISGYTRVLKKMNTTKMHSTHGGKTLSDSCMWRKNETLADPSDPRPPSSPNLKEEKSLRFYSFSAQQAVQV